MIFCMTKQEREQVFEAWLETLPEPIAARVREQFPGVADCYRMRGSGRGHYWIHSICNERNGIRAFVVHGKDSYLPGQLVEIALMDLEICDCGKYEPPEYMKIVIFATPDVIN